MRRIRNRTSKPALKNEVQVVAPQQPMPPPRGSRQSSRVKKNTDPRRSRGWRFFLRRLRGCRHGAISAANRRAERMRSRRRVESRSVPPSLSLCVSLAERRGRKGRLGQSHARLEDHGGEANIYRELEGDGASARGRRRAGLGGEEQRCEAGTQAQGDPLWVARDEAEEARSDGPATHGCDRGPGRRCGGRPSAGMGSAARSRREGKDLSLADAPGAHQALRDCREVKPRV